ncbi:unnamed protein product [Leptidea sinapis]|uniref:PHD-type domain-containing protein n=1 Tax=Leptidea sinapis TaxID=189913 RepID=A0A5E4R730_9NEOP|nr:unnamed protein product [Leptidea sinapis]
MSSSCNVCKLNVLVTQKRINCIKCQAKFHFECIVPLGTKTPVIRGQWVCSICRNKSPPTLLGCSQSDSTITTEETLASQGNWLSAIRNEVQEIISQTVSIELTKIREELSGLHDIQSSIEYLLSIFDTVKQELAEAKKEILSLKNDNSDLRNKAEQEISFLKSTVTQLHLQIGSRDQDLLQNDLEITGVTELDNENLTHIVMVASKKIGVDLSESDLNGVLRVGPKIIQKSPSIVNKHRPIVVKLVRKHKRDALLKAAKERKNLSTEDIIQGAPSKIFLNERLTKENRRLFREARIRAKDKDFKYCWVRNGGIYVRKDNGKPAIKISYSEDLDRKIGAAKLPEEKE